MSQTAAARARTGRPRATAVGVILATTAIVGVLVFRPGAPSVPTFAEPSSTAAHRVLPQPASATAPLVDGRVTEADGVLPDGATVFDRGYPGIAKLDAALLRALREATTVAAHAGVELQITSGWRSAKYQDELLREAVDVYGSAQEAARWVATADTSRHVTGDAVDVGPADATRWLSGHGAEFGLCPVYRNEPWHFELRPGAVARGCPAMYADPTRDPRMQQ